MADKAKVLQILADVIATREHADPTQSYVASLLQAPVDKVLKKIGEEATEVVIASKDNDHEQIVYESADLLFHLMVLWRKQGISNDEIYVELERRFAQSGIAEKAQRNN